jgi:hypothetical protein
MPRFFMLEEAERLPLAGSFDNTSIEGPGYSAANRSVVGPSAPPASQHSLSSSNCGIWVEHPALEC